MKISPSHIHVLDSNQVFVFGSNEAGIHGAGAAKLAFDKFGAKWGKGYGMHGRSFAIPTKDKQIYTLPLKAISDYVSSFIDYASVNSEIDFLVTEIGCGLAGYRVTDIAPLFYRALDIENIFLPERFYLLNN